MTDRLHLDFETRSEADLPSVGLYNYATHPTTRVLMLAWALNQGKVRLWVPHREPEMPAELAEMLEDPFTEKHAWNAPFERAIFLHVLKMDIPVAECHDPSVIARYISLPGKLEEAGEVLNLKEEAKMEEGKDLKKLFCEPVAIGGQPSLFGTTQTIWNDWQTHPADWHTFEGYCLQDVLAERVILKKIEKMAPPPSERRAWELDQRINGRGMPVDMELVTGATKVADIERARLADRLQELTGLENPNSVQQMLPWARERGYPFNALGKAFVSRALKGEGDVTPECREALLLRQQASKSSVHKLDAIRLLVSADGRVRDQFVFYGAATLRWGSRGVQLQNLPRPTKEVEKNMDRAIELLRAGDHATIAAEFSSPLDVVTSCLRPMFRAPAGTKFVVADLNAIENRVLGWLARSPAMLSVYAEGRCPYIDFATELYGQPYDELWHEYKVLGNGAKRTMAKPAVLGCWAADTPVLTDRGWVEITDVRKTDRLWDGVEWVRSEGCIYQGVKEVIPFHGRYVTPDHRIFIQEGEWRTAWEVIQSTEYARQAFASGSGAYSGTNSAALPDSTINASAPGVESAQTSLDKTSSWRRVGPAFPAPMPGSARSRTESMSGSLPRGIWSTGLRTDTMQSCPVVGKVDTIVTPAAAFAASSGTYTISWNMHSDCRTAIRADTKSTGSTTTGTMPKATCDSLQPRSTTVTKSTYTMSSGWASESPRPSFASGSVLSIETLARYCASYVAEYPHSRSSSIKPIVVAPTYDILNSGPRNRFLVLTDSGPAISHNCGYQLGGGEVTIDENGDEIKTGLLGYASAMSVEMTPEEAARAVALFRAKYPEVKQYWYDLEAAAIASVRNPGHDYPVGQVTFRTTGAKVLRVLLPSGRHLHYIAPKVERVTINYQGNSFDKDALTYMGKDQQTKQWVRKPSRGGHLTENLCQAIARDVLVDGMMRAEARGFPIVGHVHDELIALPALNSGLSHEDLSDCMRVTPAWAGPGSNDVGESWPALPLNAEGYEDDHYRKG